jgi:GNAT superfamily N-acetyltransferase
MIEIVEVAPQAPAFAQFCALAPALTPAHWQQQAPDLSLLAIDAQGTPQARASLWWQMPLTPAGQAAGCIGHYAANDRAAAAELLDAACRVLAAAGCVVAIGPLDGSTFRAYRFVTVRSFDGSEEPPFFLEPANPDAWPQDFRDAGFAGCAEYVSALALLDGPDPQFAQLSARLHDAGFRLRTLDLDAFDAELDRLYPLVMDAFAPNLLFAPIRREEFVAQYAPVRALIRPELVWFVEQGEETVGFLFALPDYAQAQRGEAIDTVILKTLAVQPRLASQGLGSWLAAAVHTQAAALGYRRAIHALMHRDNFSRRISAHTARIMRQYDLLARPLG